MHHDGVGDEGGGDDDDGVLAEIDEEVSKGGEAEEDASGVEETVCDLESPFGALLVLLLLPSGIRIRNVEGVGRLDEAQVRHEDGEGEGGKALGVVVPGDVGPVHIVGVLSLADHEDVALQGELGAGLEEALHRLELLEIMAHELEGLVVPPTDQQTH